ncbi:protein cereblon-like isoform X7 [Halichondria panicea]|uniref:protein cereblon-like isoform X7 n=1 Tax=Halichondria panicea TaxID=6063 RepID=UPI00312B2D78
MKISPSWKQPAAQKYLGEMEEEAPANMEDEETTPTMPLLCIPNRVLFPEETLPMHINDPHVIQMLRDASTRKKTVAVCTDLHLGDRLGGMRRPTQDELAALGTTAEIVAFREEESEYYYGPCFVVRLLGKQRFRLLKVDRRVNGLLEGHVKILPEIELPPHSSDVYACPAHIRDSCHAKQLIARTPGCSLHTRAQLELCINRLQSVRLSGSVCSVPTWVFRFYDTDHLREVLMKEQELKTFVKSDKASTRLPENIISLSYWLARRLPINEPSKLLLLSINCPTQRVIKGLQILKEFTKLHCSNCDTDLGLKEDIFSMSVDGPLAAYVNPGGYVHDTLTLTKAVHLNVQGGPSSDHSWFPGYQWTIVNCETCKAHKGWCFEATRKKLKPVKFFGLTRSGLVMRSKDNFDVQ